MVDWCCKHKDDMEIADHLPHHHLLLHFYRFGVHRVMPSKVIDVLFCFVGKGCVGGIIVDMFGV